MAAGRKLRRLTVSLVVTLLFADQAIAGQCGSVGVHYDALGNPCIGAITAPRTAVMSFLNCAVATSATTCLAASLAANHVTLQNVSPTAMLTCSWGSVPVANTTGFQLSPGQPATYGAGTGGVPTTALACLCSSGTCSLYLEYN